MEQSSWFGLQGPQYTSKLFKEITKQWGFQHITSPRHPQSNGKAEATVKPMKNLIRAPWTGKCLDEDKLTRALLQYRDTPSRKDGLSPAQKLFGQPIQDILPAHHRAFSAEWQHNTKDAEKQAISTKETLEMSNNQRAKPLPNIQVRSYVTIQNHETSSGRYMAL